MKQDYLSIPNLISAIFWIIVLLSISNYQKNRVENTNIKRFYMLNFWFKITMALVFAIVYVYYFGGGDTTAYWDGGVVLNNLIFDDFGNYIDSMISPPSDEIRSLHFNQNTGYPPGWIYREPEAWFVCKIVSLISLLTFKSYLAGTMVFAFFLASASFNLLSKVIQLKIHTIRVAAFCILFIPSVAFWCSGVSKDTLTFWAVLQLISIFLHRIVLKEKLSWMQIMVILLSIFLLYNLRVFVLAATIAPLIMAYGSRITNRYEKSSLAKFFFRTMLISSSFLLFFVFLGSGIASDLIKEAKIVQDDFQKNETYTGKRYQIDNTDPSPSGLLFAMPQSVFYGVYRPFPNEALSPALIFNGLESLMLVILSLLFLFRGTLSNIKLIINDEFLVFCLAFSFFIGFMAGFSSVLFGVLVRIRAPLLPFIFLLLTARISKKGETKEIIN